MLVEMGRVLNFGSEARDFQDELDRIEEEQRQNDADDRAAAEGGFKGGD